MLPLRSTCDNIVSYSHLCALEVKFHAIVLFSYSYLDSIPNCYWMPRTVGDKCVSLVPVSVCDDVSPYDRCCMFWRAFSVFSQQEASVNLVPCPGVTCIIFNKAMQHGRLITNCPICHAVVLPVPRQRTCRAETPLL